MRIPGGAPFRFVALILHALLGVAVTLVAPANTLSDSSAGRRIVRLWHRALLAILGVRLQGFGKAAPAPALVVANHISWLDIAALGALCPGHFVAKSEIADWPLIGWLAAQAGAFYIKRGDRQASAEVALRMADAFLQDQSVLLFPEGTSSDGTDVLPFHPRLFAAAIEHDTPVQPVVLHYPDAQGAIHPAAPFIGDETLLHNVWGLLRARGDISVEVRFLAPELPSGLSPRALATRARDVIVAHRSALRPRRQPED